jgi:hypothetical protein
MEVVVMILAPYSVFVTLGLFTTSARVRELEASLGRKKKLVEVVRRVRA